MQYYFNSNLLNSCDEVLNQRQYLDPIHGYIGFDNEIWDIIDTP